MTSLANSDKQSDSSLVAPSSLALSPGCTVAISTSLNPPEEVVKTIRLLTVDYRKVAVCTELDFVEKKPDLRR